MQPDAVLARRRAARGEHRIVLLGCRFAARALGIAVEQARHFGREQHLRPARSRLADRADQGLGIGRGVDPGVRLEERDPGHAAINSSSRPSPSSAIKIVASADVVVVDEDLRDRGPAARALDHPLAAPRR